MSKRIVTLAAAVVLVVGICGCAAFLAAKPGHHLFSRDQSVWTEVEWPFPIDEFGGGWAFQCKAADCGVEVNLYLRPKIGFCNCQAGGSVSDFAYSPALKGADLTWSADSLDRWLADPQKLIPGAQMPVRVLDASARRDIVAYLEKKSRVDSEGFTTRPVVQGAANGLR
jgi:hypothetical protein